MRIAFYAPLKAPTHPVASGDRTVARLLITALRQAGHTVDLASIFRSYDGAGDDHRQRRLQTIAGALHRRLLRRIAAGAPRPDLWFTYHPYHRAPDWIGPPVAATLGIPYVAAEASVAGKQAGGAWDRGHRAVIASLRSAALVLTLNPADAAGVASVVRAERLAALPPFLDNAPFAAAIGDRQAWRGLLAARLDLDSELPWLVAVGMMRSRAKLRSYEVLALALARLTHIPWQLIAVGDGPARCEVMQALAPLCRRVRYAGSIAPEALPAHLAACEIMVWPAIQEAYGMALLEGQAAGLPVVAGRVGGIPGLIDDGISGRLVPEGDSGAFARALEPLLRNTALRGRMGAAARRKAEAHDLTNASRRLDALIGGLVPS